MRRLVIVLVDGLRPDAISPTVMPSLDALGSGFTLALHARTVRPSATVIPTDIVTGDLGPGALPVAWALASTAGARRLVAKGSRARETAVAAHRLLCREEQGLLFVYLPDCDRAGHAYGWMSPPYLEAAAEVDKAIGALSAWTDTAVSLVTSDHGGGGVTANEHHEPHSVNDHIPLVLAGPGVTRRHQLTRPISLLDVPATALWWFGVPVPECYAGRPLAEAFAREPRLAAVPT